jgi:hypothetical protein
MSLINDALKRANQARHKAPVAGPLGVPLQTAEPPRKSALAPAVLIGAGLVLVVGLIGVLVMLGMRAFEKPPEPANAPPVQVAVAPPQPPAQLKSAATPATQPSQPKVTPPKPAASKAAAALPATTPPGKSDAPTQTTVTNPPPAQPAPLPVTGKETPVQPPVMPVETVKVTEPAVPKVVSEPPAAQAKAETVAAPPVFVPAATNPPAPVVRKVDFPDLKVTGIFYSPTRPAALVSGRRVIIGGSVQGAKVTAIARDSVTVEFEGETKVLYLP